LFLLQYFFLPNFSLTILIKKSVHKKVAMGLLSTPLAPRTGKILKNGLNVFETGKKCYKMVC